MVAKFVPESSPEPVHRVLESNEAVEEVEPDDEILALQAACPPKSVIEQRTMEAYKVIYLMMFYLCGDGRQHFLYGRHGYLCLLLWHVE
ncbi:hypothetical protein ACF0H5_013046 [Mactra antiquata]